MQNRVWTHHLFLLTRQVTPALEMILNFIARRIKSYLRSTSWYKIKHCFLVFFTLESPILKNVSSHIECLAHFIQWLFCGQSVLFHNFCWQVFRCCMAVKTHPHEHEKSCNIVSFLKDNKHKSTHTCLWNNHRLRVHHIDQFMIMIFKCCTDASFHCFWINEYQQIL